MDNEDSRPRPDPTVLTTELTHREIAHLNELMEEKFRGVDLRLDLGESLRLELKNDNQKIVDAAFDAAKTEIAAMARTIDDVKDRVSRIESTKQGGKDNMAAIYALASFLLTVLLLAGAVTAILGIR